MSSIKFDIDLKPGETKTVTQDPLGKFFHVTRVMISLLDSLSQKTSMKGIYLTELWKGPKKVPLLWKQPLSMLSVLENTVIDGNLTYRMKFLNETKRPVTLSVEIQGQFTK